EAVAVVLEGLVARRVLADPILTEELPPGAEGPGSGQAELRQRFVARHRQPAVPARAQRACDAERPRRAEPILVTREQLVTLRRDVRAFPVVTLVHVAELERSAHAALLERDADAVAASLHVPVLRRKLADVVAHVAQRHRGTLSDGTPGRHRRADPVLE